VLVQGEGEKPGEDLLVVLYTGQFLGRLKHQNFVVDHRFAVRLIYVAALVAWLTCLIALWHAASQINLVR